jgi:hypothetical protein
VTSDDFKNTFNDFIKTEFSNSPGQLSAYQGKLEWDEWLNGSGKFAFESDFTTKNSRTASQLAT